ncbi:MAG: SseB family protein [Clostridiales bacterium]|nr:SseB family protein [Clostridiales bacterium]
MDKKILARKTFNLDNAELEKAIEDYKLSKNDVKKLEELIRIFKESQVIVPVAFPKKADINVVLKMLRGEPLKKNEEFRMIPVTVSDPKGNKYAPVFTSRDMVLETKDFPYMIRIPASQVVRNVLNEKAGLTGVMLDPQTKGFIFRRQAFTTDFSKQDSSRQVQVKKVSKAEFAVLARNSVEKGQIPKTLFEKREEFVRELDERGAELLLEMYAKPYGDKLPSPYTIDDFSVMALDINDETTAVCMELPQKGLFVQAALSAYVIFNPQTKEAHYYMIEKGAKGESNVLCNITPEGRHQELMSAPPVGSELTAVLDLIREEKEEAE